MGKLTTLEKIKKSGVVAVIRHANTDNIIPMTKALIDGGINSLEITAETPKVTDLIEKVNDEFGEDLNIGAGTVLDPETARAVIMAGAKFIVSPTVHIETIKMAKRYGVISIPGGLTPTEILTAYENGADMVKVFPANTFGPSYIKDIHGPLPHIPLMVTGGIDLENMMDYFKQGSVVVGVGSSLVNPKKLIVEEDFLNLTKTATKYAEKVQEFRSNQMSV